MKSKFESSNFKRQNKTVRATIPLELLIQVCNSSDIRKQLIYIFNLFGNFRIIKLLIFLQSGITRKLLPKEVAFGGSKNNHLHGTATRVFKLPLLILWRYILFSKTSDYNLNMFIDFSNV